MLDKRYSYTILVFIILLALAGSYFAYQAYVVNSHPAKVLDYSENEVRSLVDGFGKALKNVPLLARPATITESIKNNYSPFVSQDLISQWTNDLATAPGRAVSSPWPDRIEIKNMEEVADQYTITGDIVQVTSQDLLENTFSGKREITLVVEKKDGKWVITSVVLEPIVEEKPSQEESEDGVACTMDAKMCPDGSYVGRTGPNCEFEPCPGE